MCARVILCLLHGLCVCLVACVFMCLHVCICTLLCVSAFAWRSLYRPEQNSLVKRAAISATLGEERRRGWEAMINGWGTLAEISGAVCKAVAFCLMWNKRTTTTKVPASLHGRTAALRTYTISTDKVCMCNWMCVCVLVRTWVCTYVLMHGAVFLSCLYYVYYLSVCFCGLVVMTDNAWPFVCHEKIWFLPLYNYSIFALLSGWNTAV